MKKIIKEITVASLAVVICGSVAFSLSELTHAKEKYISNSEADLSKIIKNSYCDIPENAEHAMPDSLAYYGKVEEIIKNEEGDIESIRLSSERYGEYVMNISDKTVWIDSGEKIISDFQTLTEGECIYVFHSAASTFSMPPQSAAYAVVRNIPQDTRAAQYMKVDKVEFKDGCINITANNGTISFKADKETEFSPYATKNIVTPRDIKENSRIVVWYSQSPEEKEPRAYHIMLLPDFE